MRRTIRRIGLLAALAAGATGCAHGTGPRETRPGMYALVVNGATTHVPLANTLLDPAGRHARQLLKRGGARKRADRNPVGPPPRLVSATTRQTNDGTASRYSASPPASSTSGATSIVKLPSALTRSGASRNGAVTGGAALTRRSRIDCLEGRR